MELITCKTILASQMGVNNNLFGGEMLSELDLAGAAYASQICDSPKLVTKKFEQVVFEKPVKVGRAFTQDEFKLILKECSSNDFRDLILFSFYTKLREAEIVRLTKENITNYFAHIVRVRKSTKTEKYIPIPTIVRYVVDRVKSGPIFSNWNQDRINHHWTRLRKRLQKKDLVKGNFRFYDIRHTAATWAIVHDKMRIELLSELMGHSSIQVTKDVYGHLSKEYLAEQVENLNYNLTVSLPFESKKNNKES